jgi:putative transposase
LLSQTRASCRHWENTWLAERREVWQQEQRRVGKFAHLAQVKGYRKENRSAALVHRHVLQVVVFDLDKAFQAFFRRVKAGEKPGLPCGASRNVEVDAWAAPAGAPRFKGRHRFDSFGFKEYGNGFKLDGRRLRLAGIGRVAGRGHRPIEDPDWSPQAPGGPGVRRRGL